MNVMVTAAATATAIPAHAISMLTDDAELIAACERYKAAYDEHGRALRAVSVLDERYLDEAHALHPESLIRPEDRGLGLTLSYDDGERERYAPCDLPGIEDAIARLTGRACERAKRVVAAERAIKSYLAARQLSDEYGRAERYVDLTHNTLNRSAEIILGTRARTIGGMVAKAHCAAVWDIDGQLATPVDDPIDQIVFSIVRDLFSLGGPPTTPDVSRDPREPKNAAA